MRTQRGGDESDEDEDDDEDMTLAALAERRDVAALAVQQAEQEIVSFDAVAEDDDESDSDLPRTLYRRTDPEDWTVVMEGDFGRDVFPIPYSGENEEFDVRITDEELENLKDENGDIRYYKVMDHLLPRFNGELMWEWLAAQMRNYMLASR